MPMDCDVNSTSRVNTITSLDSVEFQYYMTL